VVAMFVNGSGRNEQSLQGTFQRCFLPSFGSFGNTVSEDLYRGPSIDASYQVLVHLAKWFQRRRFKKNRPIRNKNCLWWPFLLMNRDKMSKIDRGPSIDASYQVSVHLAKGFQRRRLKCEKLMDDRRRMPSDGKSSPCLWQGELKKYSRVSYIYKHITNDKTKKSITPSFVLYIEYTFIHFGMSISCKQGSLLISK
jgi:hypothetical protein